MTTASCSIIRRFVIPFYKKEENIIHTKTCNSTKHKKWKDTTKLTSVTLRGWRLLTF